MGAGTFQKTKEDGMKCLLNHKLHRAVPCHLNPNGCLYVPLHFFNSNISLLKGLVCCSTLWIYSQFENPKAQL